MISRARDATLSVGIDRSAVLGALRPCPLCGSNLVDVLHHQAFAAPLELQAPSAYDVVACGRCGFVYANRPSTQETLDAHYRKHSKYAVNVSDITTTNPVAGGSNVFDTVWDLERLASVATYLSERVADKSARVLDAGCANGSFLAFMKERGFSNLVGLDPSGAAVANARTHDGVIAHAGSFIDPPKGIGLFDVVTLSHTLEHLTDVRGAVRSLRALLRPGGMAYIEVPDASRYVDYLVAPFHDFNTEHINHFSLRTLQAVMRAFDFRPIDAGAGVVRNSPTDRYPVAFGLWSRGHDASLEEKSFVTIEYDRALVAAAERYVTESRELMVQIDAKLRNDLAGQNDILVWGAGQLTMKLLRDTVLTQKTIVAVVDSSTQRQGMHIDNINIVAPSALRTLPPLPIVVGSLYGESSIITMICEKLSLENSIVRLFRRWSP